MMDNETLIALTADIVSAHLSNNTVATGDIPGLISSVHSALAATGEAPAPVEPERTPAVSVRSSVKADRIVCLECGKSMKMLKRHLQTDHQISPADYRARWNLPQNYPMVAADYSAKRADLAKQIGLGRKPVVKTPPATAKTPSAKKAKSAPKAAKVSNEAVQTEPSKPRRGRKPKAAPSQG